MVTEIIITISAVFSGMIIGIVFGYRQAQKESRIEHLYMQEVNKELENRINEVTQNVQDLISERSYILGKLRSDGKL